MTPRLSTRELQVLLDMYHLGAGPELALYFRALAKSKEDIPEVRRVVRRLARKGLAEFTRGLMDVDTGMVAGSGYSLTFTGLARAKAEDKKLQSSLAENDCGNG
ncbi:MAG: hypothetical protein IOB84_01560 [Brevundimonas sp.]|nr:hypothetical protein [Brevundimonas sp.]